MIPGTTASLPDLILLCQLAATFYMLGLIWFVQRVHYPLFAGVAGQGFQAYEQAHVARTGPVVGPPMLIEATTALALLAFPIAGLPRALPWLGAGLLLVIWSSTALLQMPRHRALSAGFDAAAHRQLVATNWIRTLAWSLRGLLVAWMVLRVASGAPV